MSIHITKDGFNNLDKLIIKNKWSIEYDTKSFKECTEWFMYIIVKDETDKIVITKKYDGSINTEKLDEIIYGEIIQILREKKFNELLS
jgi:hypothetical protein